MLDDIVKMARAHTRLMTLIRNVIEPLDRRKNDTPLTHLYHKHYNISVSKKQSLFALAKPLVNLSFVSFT